jgi:MoaA/NifB/PqqE/SkfB family radical SAM enzyme
MGATQDWFYRRRGAFENCLTATRRLIEVGIRPRWQLFITRRLLPELDELLALARAMGVWTPGALEPGLFAHLPSPDGEARNIEDLRPTISELDALPMELLEDSRRWLGRTTLWDSEACWYAQLLGAAPEDVPAYPVPGKLALYLLPNWDVYSNMGTLEPWWRLGNLKIDGVERVIERYCAARPLGMHLALYVSRARLAGEYGDSGGQRVYGSADDLLSRYIGEWGLAHHDGSDEYGERA